MMVYPRQTFERRSLTIGGKKWHGYKMTKEIISTTDYTEDGRVVSETRWAVQRYDSVGMPVGRKYFDSEAKARKYYESSIF